jgi:hypothetical protein
MSQTPEPYPIDPQGDQPPAPPEPKPKIERAPLTEGFEEDADFTHDPELDRVIAGRSAQGAPAAVMPAEPPRGEFVRPRSDWEPKLWAAVGGALTIGALIATAVNAPTGIATWKRVALIALTLYDILLHTGTGVAAVLIAALLLGQRLGRVEVAAARMFAAVAAFMFVFCLKFTITSTKFEETVFAALAYLLVVAVGFRLWRRDPLMYVVGAHFALWLVVQVGMLLAAAAVVPSVPKVGA